MPTDRLLTLSGTAASDSAWQVHDLRDPRAGPHFMSHADGFLATDCRCASNTCSDRVTICAIRARVRAPLPTRIVTVGYIDHLFCMSVQICASIMADGVFPAVAQS